MLLYIAMFAVFIVGILEVGSVSVNNSDMSQQMRSADLMATARQGAFLYVACSSPSIAAGQYTPAALGVGINDNTALGNQWGCVKSPGGAFGGLITLVTFTSAPTFIPGGGPGGAGNSLIQENIAYQISEDLVDMVQFQANTVVGTILPGSLTMSQLAPAGATLPILSSGLGYATPAIVGGLYTTTPTNNQTATPP